MSRGVNSVKGVDGVNGFKFGEGFKLDSVQGFTSLRLMRLEE